jgi:HAD superfamily hydrolase (TIGR01509 family)
VTTPIKLISLDVGGTLGVPRGPGLTQRLVERSPLTPTVATAVIRRLTLTCQTMTGTRMLEVCDALRIPPDASLFVQPAPTFVLYPATERALRDLARIAPLVTLSNVSCIDVNDPDLRCTLAAHVEEQFPSCRIGYAKPDAEAFHAVAAARAVRPEQIVHIGDDWACDLLGALRAGCRAMWISRGRPVPDESVFVGHAAAAAADLAHAAAYLAARSEELQ